MSTLIPHTGYLTTRLQLAVLRQPAYVVMLLIQPMIWLVLFGQLFNAVRPTLGIGPGKKEAVAPHRFAEALGAICLLAAAALYFAGAELAAQVLTLMVVALALLNAAEGICVGCQMYLLLKRFSGKGATA